MTRWGMVIDLRRCLGCYSCMIACKEEHFLTPNMFWNRVLVSEVGTYPDVSKLIYPVSCNHCEDPACVKACPTRATTRRADGIVVVDSDKCAGCRYCLVSCPYQQRTFHADDKKEYFPGQGLTEYEVMGKKLYPLQKGTVVKCNFCAERVDAGLQKGLKPGIDREATPACVITCGPQARHFGDLDDPQSEVSRLIKENKGWQLHPEYGTNPSLYYIS
jgi:phenylacetyl-CoA:acceptor oxidoreductase 27-kDa subunit